MASLDPNRLGPHPKSTHSDIPHLTEHQRYALQAVADSAHRTELQLRLETGDLLFFNNWALLHRRDAYIDDNATSRHLVRLWLRNQKLGWNVPESMLTPWEAAYGDNEKIKERFYPLIPAAEYREPKYSAGSAAFVIEDD